MIERDFSNFYLGDNVYDLAGGLIADLADRFNVELENQPDTNAIQQVLDIVGTNKVLRDNPEINVLSKEEKADFVERSGVQKALKRSLWSPDIQLDESVDLIMFSGGVVNWMDRISKLVVDLSLDKPVYILGGNRSLTSPTEITNPKVIDYQQEYGQYPDEFGYICKYIIPSLIYEGIDVRPFKFATNNADDMLKMLLLEEKNILKSKVAMLRVANAGVIMAIQLRQAARHLRSDFDANKDQPQLFIATDSLDVARTEEQDSDPLHFQKADTALRQILLTAKKLVEVSST